MKFEKSIARLIRLYVILSFVILASALHFYADADILHERAYKFYGILAFSVVLLIVVIYFEGRYIAAEKERFIKALISDRAERLKKQPLFRNIYHSFQMVKQVKHMEEEEMAYLEMILSHYDVEISNLENESERLKQEKQRYMLELEAAELEFVALANSIESGILVVDRECRITFANNILVHRFPNITVGDHLSGVLDIPSEDCDLFVRRDYGNITFRIWDRAKTRAVLSSSRVFVGDEPSNIIFVINDDYENNVSADIIRHNQEFSFMLDSLGVLSSKVTERVLKQFLEQLCHFCAIESASVRILSEDRRTLKLYTSHQDSAFVLNKEEIYVKNSNMGAAFGAQKPLVIDGRASMLIPERHVENLVDSGYVVSYFPLSIQTANVGVLSLVSRNAPSQSSMLILKFVCVNLAIALEKILLYDKLKNNYFDVIKAFLKAYELKVRYKRGHSVRVARICRMMAKKLYYDDGEIDNIYNAALLHDVGKMLVLDDTEEYVSATANHSKLGRQIMEKVGFDEEILQGIEFHHDDYRSENGILPIYPQFIRIANDFDTYVEGEPTQQKAQEFIDEVCKSTVDVYAPNLVNVLESIISTDTAALLGIFGESNA